MRRLVAGILVGGLLSGVPAVTSPAAPASAGTSVGEPAAAPPAGADSDDVLAEPDEVLARGWRESSDRAVTTAADGTGLHIMVADRRDAYRWRAVASLREPGFDTDQWIGQLCVTASGRRAVVVYAPRAFANHPSLMERGGFAAVVDLDSGQVDRIAERVSLAYFNPACGVDERALLSRLEQPSSDDAPARTWIGELDTARGSLTLETRADGQVTSPVRIGDRILAAKGYSVVEVDAAGGTDVVAHTAGAPHRLMADGTGRLAFQIAREDDMDLATLTGSEVEVAATVPLGAVALRPGAGGDVYAVGMRATERLPVEPQGWHVVDASPSSEPSTAGGLLVTRATTGAEAAGRVPDPPVDREAPQPVQISAVVDPLGPGEEVQFTVLPDPEPDPAPVGTLASTDPADVPWDPDRACAVPRNDPQIQVYQPSGAEVEWAVNLAVRGELTAQRPANWLNNGLPAYSPQAMFPPLNLSGGGHVPAQVLLAILAQESNLYQASWRVVDGLAGNTLTSAGFYGLHWGDPDAGNLDWRSSHVDCGYGIGQITTGMHSSDTNTIVGGIRMDPLRQQAVAQDFAVNIAAGLRLLQGKWNEIYDAGVIANDGDPRYLENWWFAVWAYNSGFQPDARFGNTSGCRPGPNCTDQHGNWGLGWSNNPASPLYPADRRMFLTAPLDHPDVDPPDQVGYDNARHPNHWSYPERVMGFAYTSLRRWDYQRESWLPTYQPAERSTSTESAQPGRYEFCAVDVNSCDPSASRVPGQFPDYPAGPCLRDDLRCWWNGSVNWATPGCDYCGVEYRLYSANDPAPPRAVPIHSSQCQRTGLPATALIVNTLNSATPVGPHGCSRTWGDNGTFNLTYGSKAGPQGGLVYPSKVDLHQINGGFGGHFWVGHVRNPAETWMELTGDWRLNRTINGPAVVWVHLPDHGARTLSARYQITTANGVAIRDVPQYGNGNRWMSLGAFMFDGAPRLRLTNLAAGGDGSMSIAFDAVAFQPVPGALSEHEVSAYAMFDENQDIDADPLSTWLIDTPLKSRQELYDWGYRTAQAVAGGQVCQQNVTPNCVPRPVREAAVDWREEILTAGIDPVDHPPGAGIANWINFANPYTYRPTSFRRPAHFDRDDSSYKIRSRVVISFVTGPDGQVVEGSEYAEYSHRTGKTHLPGFVLAAFESIEEGYGISRPQLTFTAPDLYEYQGQQHVARPHIDGVLPGRAYLPAGSRPVITEEGDCVGARFVSGGSIGYRPMLGVGMNSDRVAAWVEEIRGAAQVTPAVENLAVEIYHMFFRGGVTGSIFVQAPPIWQELNVRACADGRVTRDGERPILLSSHMPDQYLYHDGVAINLNGAPTSSALPVVRGDFQSFSRAPDPSNLFLWPNPYGRCSPSSGQSGNPWGITMSAPANPGVRPDQVAFCSG